MKTWVKVLLGIVGAIVLAVSAAFYFTSDLTKPGDEFFAAVADGDMDRAHGALSSAFRAGTGEAELAAYLAANRMDRVTATSWTSRSAKTGGVGSLAGTLTTAEGETVPVEIDLVKEDGAWKIYAIRRAAGRAGVGEGARGLPREDEQVALVADSMAAFVDALAAQDMTGFHAHISRLWAREFDVARLDDAYRALYGLGAAAQVVKSMAPVFDGPATLSDSDFMEIRGYYPTSPSRFHFTLTYIYEGTGWKLAGLASEVR